MYIFLSSSFSSKLQAIKEGIHDDKKCADYSKKYKEEFHQEVPDCEFKGKPFKIQSLIRKLYVNKSVIEEQSTPVTGMTPDSTVHPQSKLMQDKEKSDASFEVLKQKLATMMPAGSEGNEDGSVSSTTSIQKVSPQVVIPTLSNQDSMTSQTSEAPRPSLGFATQVSVDQGTPEPAGSATAPKRKEDTIADLEQNLQSIMGTVGNKPKNPTTTPSTPTTAAGQPSFAQVAAAEASAVSASVMIPAEANADPQQTSPSSRFQVSPITEERPANKLNRRHSNKNVMRHLGLSMIAKWEPRALSFADK